MEKHLEEMRIMELALSDKSALQNGEKAHLESCALCKSLLDEERNLSSLIPQMEVKRVPDGFASEALAVFKRSNRARRRKYLSVSVASLGAALAYVVLSVVFQSDTIVSAAFDSLKNVIVGIKALITVASIDLYVTAATIGGMSLAASIGCLLLARIFQKERSTRVSSRGVPISRGQG